MMKKERRKMNRRKKVTVEKTKMLVRRKKMRKKLCLLLSCRKKKAEKASSLNTTDTTPKQIDRSSPRKKKVIITEQFPNRPDINFGFGFFKSVQQNAGKARARMDKEKPKISPCPSFTKRNVEDTSSTNIISALVCVCHYFYCMHIKL